MAAHGPFAFLGLNTQNMAGVPGMQGLSGNQLQQMQEHIQRTMGGSIQGPLGPGQMPPGGPPPPMGAPPLPPGPPPQMDPSANNAPLQFNINKGKPPMPIPGAGMHEEDKRLALDRLMIEQTKNLESQKNNPHQQRKSQDSPNENIDVSPNMMGLGPINPWMTQMGGDPNMMMMGPMGFNQNFGFMNGPTMGPGPGPGGPVPIDEPAKEIITLKDCTLYPPPPNAPPPTTRDRPPGCRTVFVGGLPETATEECIREMFEGSGTICSIRLSKKNFSHIRFEAEESVEKALFYSGYRMKIENKDDKPNTGRIHVDYAQARDDLYEWECKQRALMREQRHRQRIEEERLRPPSPPPIIHYSDHESTVLLERLKADDSFMKGTQVLITWLERGDCSKRTCNQFYGMVQSVNSHVRRLMNEKALYDEEYEAVKAKFRLRLEGIIRQFEQIENVFNSATKQKAWDHFSKAQRKNLDLWKRQAQEIHKNQQQEFLKERQEDEMEMSDSDEDLGETGAKKRKLEGPGSAADWVMSHQIKEENDSLKCQLEAYKNEVDILKQENTDMMEEKDKQLKALQQALQGMQQQLMTAKQQIKDDVNQKTRPIIIECGDKEETATSSSASQAINDREARLIGLISTFLHVHPFGASVDYIWSYLQRLDIHIRSSEIEDLLEKLPTVFKQSFHGVGASIEKRWKYLGLENDKN